MIAPTILMIDEEFGIELYDTLVWTALIDFIIELYPSLCK